MKTTLPVTFRDHDGQKLYPHLQIDGVAIPVSPESKAMVIYEMEKQDVKNPDGTFFLWADEAKEGHIYKIDFNGRYEVEYKDTCIHSECGPRANTCIKKGKMLVCDSKSYQVAVLVPESKSEPKRTKVLVIEDKPEESQAQLAAAFYDVCVHAGIVYASSKFEIKRRK